MSGMPTHAVALSEGRQKLERGGSDDAQCAFAADKQMAQVVAGGVFMQGMEMGNQFAVGEDDFQTDNQVAHRAVTQYVQTSGIAGDVAADLARAFAGETEWEQPV